MTFLNSLETYSTLLAITAGAMFVSTWVISKVRLSSDPAYKSVRIARNILAIDYFIIAISNILRICTKQVDVVSINVLVGMWQTLLITSSLSALVNPAKASWRWVEWQSGAIALLVGIDLWAKVQWPEGIFFLEKIMLVIFILQMIGYTLYFFHVYSYTVSRLKDYFNKDEESRISWIRYSFIAFLFGCILAAISQINWIWFNSLFVITYTIIYTYIGIGFISKYYNYTGLLPVVVKITNEEQERKKNKEREERIAAMVKENETSHQIEQLAKALDTWVKKKAFLIPSTSLDDVLKVLDTTRPMLRTFMKKKYGMDFSTWRNNLRLEHARELIEHHPELTVETIAEMVGYSDTGNFARAFKLKYGKTPKGYRENP